jgi:molybdopterin-guanine dinucleotide biosynthesis protein
MVSMRESARRKTDKPGAEPEPSKPGDRIDLRTRFPGILATVSICGAASNAGKTWLCESVLRGLRAEGRRTLALKVTRTHHGDCPRGIDTCGTCDSLKGDFEIVRDRSLLDAPRKDTGRYFGAGADRVLWLLVKPSSVQAGVLAALREVPAGFVLVAEGNSFRDYASADVALMALSEDGELKASARHVIDRIDACVRHHRTAGRPRAGAAMGGLPLLGPEEAWPFVRDRIAGARRPAPEALV